jgi:hypothetical protein
VLLSASLKGLEGPFGLYRFADGTISPLVVPGQEMPGGGRFKDLVFPWGYYAVSAANDAGQHAFEAVLAEGSQAAYRLDADGKLSLILKSGANTELAPFTGFGPAGSPNNSTGISLNNRGQVAMTVKIAGGPDTVVLLTPTGPSALIARGRTPWVSRPGAFRSSAGVGGGAPGFAPCVAQVERTPHLAPVSSERPRCGQPAARSRPLPQQRSQQQARLLSIRPLPLVSPELMQFQVAGQCVPDRVLQQVGKQPGQLRAKRGAKRGAFWKRGRCCSAWASGVSDRPPPR